MERKNTVDIPNVWDELTGKDWRSMLILRERIIKMINQKKDVSIKDVRNEAARILMRNRGVRARFTNDMYYLLVCKIAGTLTWLWRDYESGEIELVYQSTVQLLPRFRKWNGPRSHGEDLTFGEFKQAVSLLQTYNETNDEDVMSALCGLLYRPQSSRRKTGLWRMEMDNETAEDWIRRGRAMPDWFKWGVYAWISAFCNYLTSGDFIIDGEQVNFAPLFVKGEKKEEKKKNDIGLNAIAFTMAESRVFGELKDVEHTQLLKIFLKLLNDYNKTKEMEAKK